MASQDHAFSCEWVHITYEERSRFAETYGYSGTQGKVNLEGMLLRPTEGSSKTLII